MEELRAGILTLIPNEDAAVPTGLRTRLFSGTVLVEFLESILLLTLLTKVQVPLH